MDLCRRHGFSEASYYLWPSEIVGIAPAAHGRATNEFCRAFAVLGERCSQVGDNPARRKGADANDIALAQTISNDRVSWATRSMMWKMNQG